MLSHHYRHHRTGKHIHTTGKNVGNDSGNDSGNNLIHNTGHQTTLAPTHHAIGNPGKHSGNKIGNVGKNVNSSFPLPNQHTLAQHQY